MTAPLPPRDDLLAIFDGEARRMSPDAAEGRPFTLDGPVMRIEFATTGVVRAPNDLGIDGPQLEALIERQVRHFAERGKPVEWKTYADDRPDTLIPLLLAAGFEPEPIEAVMVAAASSSAPQPPAGIRIRHALDDDVPAVAALLGEIWGADHGWLVREFAQLRAELGDGFRILVATADGRVVSAAWVVMHPGTRFAGLWGGSTHPDFRRRGIYRALVAARSAIAHERGFPYLRVDASAMSRPVLDSLGFVQLTTTTPYVWSP
jgi:GNAT superfamily N-acetyltransferase